MALQMDDNYFCKVIFSDGGRVVTRRVSCIVVQQADGIVVRHTGSSLPDSLTVFVGPQAEAEGKGLLEVIQRPAQTTVPPAQPTVAPNAALTPRKFFSERDGFIYIAGMLTATFLFMWIFTAWVELRDFRLRATAQAPYRSYQQR